MKKWEYFSKEELEQFVKESTSLNQVAIKCGYSSNGGSGNAAIREMIEIYHFDISHFLDLNGSSHNKGQFNYDRFKKGNAIKIAEAKPAIIALRGHECECCHNKEWLGKLIPLEVHHIDGDNLNNDLNNLQLLCPNCHAQTDNYRGKNITQQQRRESISEEEFIKALKESPNIRQALLKLSLAPKGANYTRANEIMAKNNFFFPKEEKEPIIIKPKEKKEYKCKLCGKEISHSATYCEECGHKIQRKVEERPTREELKELIRKLPFLQIGEKYGVSDNAIRKWCVAENLPKTKKEINSYSDEEWKRI